MKNIIAISSIPLPQNADEVSPFTKLEIKAIASSAERFCMEGLDELNGLENIKKIHFTLDPFTIENEILTPTMKIKRNVA